MMHPYRPLFAIDEPDDRPGQEIRGLAVLLVVLGALRVVPALFRDEGATTEIAIAVAMLLLGIAILLRLPRLWRRRRGLDAVLSRR